MKGVVNLINLIIIIAIIISLGSMLWFFLSGFFLEIAETGEASTQETLEVLTTCMKIEEAYQNKFFIRNCGKGLITNNSLNVYVDDEPITFELEPVSIGEGKTGTLILNEIWGIPIEQHTLRIVNPNTEVWTNFEAELPDSTILALDFDEGGGNISYDKSGYNNNGILKNFTGSCGGTACPTWVKGKYGYALDFDGIGDYVFVGNDSSLRVNDSFKIELWLKLNSQDTGELVGKYWGEYSFSCCFSVVVYDSPPPPQCPFTGSTYRCSLSSPYTLTPNKWYHVSGVFTGQSIDNQDIYVNGNVINSLFDVGGRNVNQGTANLHIGDNYENSGSINATIDSIRIYNKALTPDETLNFRII